MIALSMKPQCEPPVIVTNCRGASHAVYWFCVVAGATIVSCEPTMKRAGRCTLPAAAAADGFVSAAASVARHLMRASAPAASAAAPPPIE